MAHKKKEHMKHKDHEKKEMKKDDKPMMDSKKPKMVKK